MALTLKISGKTSDCFWAGVFRDDEKILDYNGYVPKCVGGGDYIELDIDVETGKILNWKPMSEREICTAIDGTKIPYVVLNDSKLIYGPDTEQACHEWLMDFCLETCPEKCGSKDALLEVMEKYFDIIPESDHVS